MYQFPMIKNLCDTHLTWVQILQNVLKYKCKHFKICQVLAQAQTPYLLKYLSPSKCPHDVRKVHLST